MNEEKIIEPADGIDNGEQTSFGKFKSASELLKAYNALEGEFTRRSQRLAEYEKRSAPTRESIVSEFVDRYPVAENYAEEIAAEIAKNGSEPDGAALEHALLNVLTAKVKTVDEMAQDEKVIDRVLSSEKNRSSIINDYLDGIRRNVPPITLPKGGATPVIAGMRARTVADAGKIAYKIFNE